LQYQGQTQIGLKQLDLQGLQYQTSAAADVTNKQTEAELELGLGSQHSQVEIATLAAGIQMASIQAIERAYGVLNGPTGPNNVAYGGAPVAAPVAQVGSYPSAQVATPIYTQQQPAAVAVTPSGNGIVDPATLVKNDSGWWNNVSVPGTPDYTHSDPSQYPGLAPGAICSPLDGYCVAHNEDLSNQYHLDMANAQTKNNLTQSVANYQISVDAGVITPSQLAEMQAAQRQLASLG